MKQLILWILGLASLAYVLGYEVHRRAEVRYFNKLFVEALTYKGHCREEEFSPATPEYYSLEKKLSKNEKALLDSIITYACLDNPFEVNEIYTSGYIRNFGDSGELNYSPFSGKEDLAKRLDAISEVRFAIDRKEDLTPFLSAYMEDLTDKQQEHISRHIMDN